MNPLSTPPTNPRPPRATRLLAVLSLLLIGSVGCCYPKGYVLRGDFALELNRVNWLLSRDVDVYEGEMETFEQDAVAASEMDVRGGLGHEVSPQSMQPAMSGAGVRSRFHPVPTMPAFTPKTDPELEMLPAPDETGATGGMSKRGTPARRGTEIRIR